MNWREKECENKKHDDNQRQRMIEKQKTQQGSVVNLLSE